MEEISDAITFGQHAVRMGLLSRGDMDYALEEARVETGKQVPELIYLTRTLERKGHLTNFQTSKLLRGDEEGFFLGGYRILYKVSSGSFGRVFRADDPRTGNVVALKVLRRRWSEDQVRIDLFIREGKVGLTLKHPNIVEVLAISQDPSTKQYFIAMEFVEGGNLREILAIRKTLKVPEALRILEDCATGLTYAFSKGITHRDIKLTNTLISTMGAAKLVDFGLAQIFAKIGGEEDQVDRTVDYAGLEKSTGVKAGDVRSDIFFLGCVFYEILTGRSPLDMTRDRHARMHKKRFEDVLKLRPGEIDAPPSVYQLSETMLAFDPRKRHQTPAQLLEIVKAARREVGVTSATPSAGPVKKVKGPRTQSLFLVESHHGLQEALRQKFKDNGYRVYLASDPLRALDRFRLQPYEILIVDVDNVGEEGLLVFEHVLTEAEAKGFPFVGIVVLGEEQTDLLSRIRPRPNAAVLVRPVSWKQLHKQLKDLLGEES